MVSEKTELTGKERNRGTTIDEDPEDLDESDHDTTKRTTNRDKIDQRCFNDKTLRKIKAIGGHVGLLVTLMIYTIAGGVIFRHLELPAELLRLEDLRSNVYAQRNRLVRTIVNNTDTTNIANLINHELRAYEAIVEKAAQSGLLASLVAETNTRELNIIEEHRPTDLEEIEEIIRYHSRNSRVERWSVLQAVFFASTVLTTIGYGNVVPTTFWGRMFCILFALVGIPLTLTVIADWGRLFAGALSHVGRKIKPRIPKIASSCIPNNITGRRSLGAFVAVVFLFLYLSCGAVMFMLWEEDWGFFEGFYFCFVTMTTIGFGDLVPKKPKYMLLCTLYILVGLALTSTIIELVRRQYARSWRQLRALSGPLAETLRRLGEHAGGDMSALQSDLRRVLAVVSMPRLKRGGSTTGIRTTREELKRQREWEEAVEAVIRDIASGTGTLRSPPSRTNKPIVQIVIYESSV